jgi:hypothetical protein
MGRGASWSFRCMAIGLRHSLLGQRTYRPRSAFPTAAVAMSVHELAV